MTLCTCRLTRYVYLNYLLHKKAASCRTQDSLQRDDYFFDAIDHILPFEDNHWPGRRCD
jgi:hypothetical protein